MSAHKSAQMCPSPRHLGGPIGGPHLQIEGVGEGIAVVGEPPEEVGSVHRRKAEEPQQVGLPRKPPLRRSSRHTVEGRHTQDQDPLGSGHRGQGKKEPRGQAPSWPAVLPKVGYGSRCHQEGEESRLQPPHRPQGEGAIRRQQARRQHPGPHTARGGR